MRFRRVAPAVFLALTPLATAARAEDAPALFALFPKDTVAALAVEGAPAVKGAFDASSWGSAWKETEVREWLAPLVGKWNEAMHGVGTRLGFTAPELWATFEKGSALALLDFEATEDDLRDDPRVAIAFVADLGGKRGAFEAYLGKLVEKARAEGGATSATLSHAGVEIREIRPPREEGDDDDAPTIRWAFVGSRFLLGVSTTSTNPIERLIDRASGKDAGNSLLQSERFRAATAKTGGGLGLFYADLGRIWDVVRESGDDDDLEKMKRFGVLSLHSVAASVSLAGGRTRCAAYLGGARDGLFSLAQMPVGEFRTLALAPKDAAGYAAYRVEAKKVWQVAMGLFEAVGDAPDLEAFRGHLRQEESKLGFSIEEDLLGNFGDEVAFVVARGGGEDAPEPDDEGVAFLFASGIGRTAFLASLRRSDRIEGQIEALLKRVGLGATLRTEEFEGVALHSFMAAAIPVTYAVAGDHLVVGLDAEQVKAVVANAKKPDASSLRNDARFARAFEGIPSPRAAITFTDTREQIENAGRVFSFLGAMLPSAGAGDMEWLSRLAKLPVAGLSRHLTRDAATALLPDGDGVLWISVGP